MKLSEVPAGTTVAYLGADLTKHNDGNWYGPFVKSMTGAAMEQATSEVKIISMPYSIVLHLAEQVRGYDEAEWHSHPDGTPFTTKGIIRDAIETVGRTIYSAENPLKEDEL